MNMQKDDKPQTVNTPTSIQQQPAKAPIPMGRSGVQLSTFEDAWRFSVAISQSGFAPKGMEKTESVLAAVQLGLELGMTPMTALQNIAVINGRPGIYGDAALALVRASGLLEKYEQKIGMTSSAADSRTASVTVKRRGESEMTTEFSIADAKRANLWGKSGPWSQHPDRMLLFRARGFALRDAFGDVLKGLRTSEELGDIPPEPMIDVTPKATAGARLASVIGGAAKAKEQAAQPAPVDQPNPAPASAPVDAPAANREEIEDALKMAMLDGDVSERRMFEYAQKIKVVPEGVDELFALPTETLEKLIKAVPGLTTKKGVN